MLALLNVAGDPIECSTMHPSTSTRPGSAHICTTMVNTGAIDEASDIEIILGSLHHRMMMDALEPRPSDSASTTSASTFFLASAFVASSPGLVVRNTTSRPILLPRDEEKCQHASTVIHSFEYQRYRYGQKE